MIYFHWSIDQYGRNIKVGSTEEFQGQERRVIIISTVRSSDTQVNSVAQGVIGFLSNPKRFNVAITRAQAGLIICGNAKCLALDPLWNKLLIYIKQGGGMVGGSSEEDETEDSSDDDSELDQVETLEDDFEGMTLSDNGSREGREDPQDAA